MTTRRRFLKMGAAAGAGALTLTGEGLFVMSRVFASVQIPQTPLDGAKIPQFTDPLPTFVGSRVSRSSFTVSLQEFQQKVLPTSMYANLSRPFNNGTYVWGFKVDSRPASYPGFTVEALQGTPTTITYVNNLPIPSRVEPLFSIDQTIHWADPFNQMGSTKPYTGPIPGVVHLHGAEVPSAFDGAPEAWFTPTGLHGKGYASLAPTSKNAAIYRYPNTQPATTLWFHDHALGITRFNIFAGLAAFYLVRDQFDTGHSNNPLHLPAGSQEIELLIQDRQFDTNGQLLFPDGSSANNNPTATPTGLNGPPPNPATHPFWIPEFFGDTMVVNGKVWPFLNVEPRRYRFRILNGANARFLRMYLQDARSNVPGPVFWQIGTDGSLLDNPVRLNYQPGNTSLPLFLAPSERADVIIDFTGLAGRSFILKNDAQAPYPSGDPPDPATNGQIMKFNVSLPLSSQDTTYNPASGAPLRGGSGQPPVIVRLTNPATGTLAAGVQPSVKRQLTLIEVEGDGGPLEVLVNNTKWKGVREGTSTPLPGSQPDKGGQGIFLTELPRVGATEEWEIINLTEDAHPIHIHLIQFQYINRQAVDVDSYRAKYDSLFPGGTYIPGFGPPQTYTTPNAAGAIGGNPDFTPFLSGNIIPPEANEAGWKDSLKMLPGFVTRIAIRWAPIATPVNGVKPGQNLYQFDPTVGPGYVWHCHILDHEDNEMMRPYAPTM